MILSAGPSSPLQPSNLTSTGVTHNTATIFWTVSRIAYTPETYTVHFGTSPGSLTSFSQQRQSGDNFTATNLSFFVDLTGLSAGTTYYYQVVAVNSVGSTQSSGPQFRTNELRKRMFLTCKLQLPIHRVSLFTGLDYWTDLFCHLYARNLTHLQQSCELNFNKTWPLAAQYPR